jgi:tRNA G18 (ribose-2'-O)-methylase SpoU
MGADVVEITDAGDPRVADFRALNDAAFRRRVEAPTSFHPGTFVIEGWLALERAIASHQDLRAVLVLDTRLDRVRATLDAARLSPTVLVADAPVVEAVVGFDLHRGVVAVANRPRVQDVGVVVARARRLLVVEGVNDGENLGVLFRNAAALGADGVVLDPISPDPLSRRAVRVSTGHVLAVPWARLPWPRGLTDVVAASGTTIVALTPAGDTDLRDVSIGPDDRVAVMVGAEGPGLSDDALAAADVRARIPMARQVDSVNVASAAAVAMWHLFRA